MTKRIAIIGAGLSGLILACELAAKAEVTVFEKARGVGGRMSTRYADPFYFDHGTQYFTARTPEFQSFLAPLIAESVVQPWKGSVVTLGAGIQPFKRLWYEPHYVASPNMNSLCKSLAMGINLKTNCEIAPLSPRQPDGWHLVDKDGMPLGIFDLVISTAPPVQTLRLFAPHIPETSRLHHARLLGCYALMLGFSHPPQISWIAAKIQDNPISWVSQNSSKPGRNPAVTTFVAHTDNTWSEYNIDNDMAEAQAYLLEQFEAVTGIPTASADYISTHRWRYAMAAEPEATTPYHDPALGLAAVSDWCAPSRIEDVWHAAMRLSSMLG